MKINTLFLEKGLSLPHLGKTKFLIQLSIKVIE